MIRLFFVDNHPLILEGLRALLDAEEGITVAGKARNGAACMSSLGSQLIDVVLTDVCLPDIDGIDLCSAIKMEHPHVQVLALSSCSEVKYITEMMRHGASGYVFKDADREELLEAIHTVYAGNTYFSPTIKEVLGGEVHESKHHFRPLTKREKEVLLLIAEGNTNPEIAEKLFISADTVNSHRKNLLAKLEVKNTAMLIKYAVDNKLLV